MCSSDLEEAINPFCLWNGANFKLKMTRQSGFPNYDESTFLAPGPLTKDEKELEEIWKSEYSLAEIVDPKNFKTYDELKRRLEDVMGLSGSAPRATREVVEEEDVPFKNSKPTSTPAPASKKAPVVEEDDEDLAMFKELAELDD